MNRLFGWICGGLLVAVSFGVPVQGETLGEAMQLAYATNPVLIANRAGLRSTDEGVAQARAARRPHFTIINNYSHRGSKFFSADNWRNTDTYMVSLNASLTLYDGGRSRIAVEAAQEAVAAARASLLDVEQSVMLNAAIAYLDVRRDIQTVNLARNNVALLRRQLQAANDRLAVGAITRTDVSVTEARLAAAQSALAARRGALAISQEAYRAAVGVAPVDLAAPPALPDLPGSQQAAEDVAIRNHPLMIAARHAEKTAMLDLRRARATRLPTITADASYGANYDFDPFFDNQNWSETASIGITSTMPLYAGGGITAGIRQAAAILEMRMAQTESTRVSLRQQVGNAWFQLQIARSSIAAIRLQIEAAQFVLDGTRQEADLGSRTLLDVLNAEQDVLDAKTNLISAIHDEQVGGYMLLSAMGLLTAENLDLGMALYDPNENYDRVQRAPLNTFGAGQVLDNIADRWQ